MHHVLAVLSMIVAPTRKDQSDRMEQDELADGGINFSQETSCIETA